MNRTARTLGIAALAVLALAPAANASSHEESELSVYKAAGHDATQIQGTVDAYRNALGVLNPNVAGSLGSGRREINWDGVPDALSAPNFQPPDFFNVNTPRGVVTETPGVGVQDSAKAGIAPIEFDNINPTYSRLFRTFSAQRLFAPIGSNKVVVKFFVPGTQQPATVSGFGSVFTDVDHHGSTKIEYYDDEGDRLAKLRVPNKDGNETLSFLGARFSDDRVAKVVITSGNSALGPDEAGGRDIVAMDDFIYGEPTAESSDD